MVVVLPTPPFWLAMAMTRGSSRAAGFDPLRSSVAVAVDGRGPHDRLLRCGGLWAGRRHRLRARGPAPHSRARRRQRRRCRGVERYALDVLGHGLAVRSGTIADAGGVGSADGGGAAGGSVGQGGRPRVGPSGEPLGDQALHRIVDVGPRRRSLSRPGPGRTVWALVRLVSVSGVSLSLRLMRIKQALRVAAAQRLSWPAGGPRSRVELVSRGTPAVAWRWGGRGRCSTWNADLI